MISFVEYVGELEDVENIAQHAVNGETTLRHKPVEIPVARLGLVSQFKEKS